MLRGHRLEILEWANFEEHNNKFSWKARWPDRSVGTDAGRQKIFDCDTEHVAFVEDAWEWRNEGGEVEKQAARKAFGDCLRETGLAQVVDPATEADIAALLADESVREEIPRCIAEAYEATGAAPF